MKRFAVFDIDGTVIRWQLYHAIVDELGAQGHLSPDALQEIHDARMTWKSRTHSQSFDAYEETLIEVYHRALTNLNVSDYTKAVDTVFETYKDQVYTYSRDLIRELKEQGYLLFIISGSQHEIIQKLGDYYGFDDVVGGQYLQKDGHFTGEMLGVYGRKDEVLRELINKYKLGREGSVAIGDSTSDIAMLEMVERPIAFNPTKSLLEHATRKGWEVVVERKNVVYELKARDGSYVLAPAD
jgi:HAD superfamily hydrolase (TIGR01490 family)